MFLLESYPIAVVFCVVTMFCWGSWANTQKLAGKTWRFELYYWDYVIGVLLASVIFAFTLLASAYIGNSDRRAFGAAIVSLGIVKWLLHPGQRVFTCFAEA